MISPKKMKLFVFGTLITALSMFVVVVSAVKVQAETETSTSTSERTTEAKAESKQKIEELRKQKQLKLQEEAAKRQAEQLARQEKKTELREKLEGKRLEACEKKEKAITSNMQKIVKGRTAQLEVFDKIFAKTQEFYVAKGLSVANHEELVADADAKKAVAYEALNKLKAANVDFMCESEQPLKMAEVFKGAREEMYRSMKDYRAAIKVLIAETRTAVSKKEETN